MNVFHDDHETVAEYIQKRLQYRKDCIALAAPDGTVRLNWSYSNQELTALSKQANFIGLFTNQTLTENIEDEVLYWVRQQATSVVE